MKQLKTLPLFLCALLLVLLISGCQAPSASNEASHAASQSSKLLANGMAPNDEEASHTTYEVSKPLVKNLTLRSEERRVGKECRL